MINLTSFKILLKRIYSKENGDVICHTLKFCWTDPGQNECHLLRKTQVFKSCQEKYSNYFISLINRVLYLTELETLKES